MTRKIVLLAALLCMLGMASATGAFAQTVSRTTTAQVGTAPQIPFVDISVRQPTNNKEVALSIQLLLLLAVLTLAPSIIILMTSFLRISIVFDFVKRALSLQQVPQTQVLTGIALFLTMFIMWPTFDRIYVDSFKPFADGKIGIEEMYSKGVAPLRVFMFKQMQDDPKNIALFMSMRGLPKPNNLAEVPDLRPYPRVRSSRDDRSVQDRDPPVHSIHRNRHGGRLNTHVDGHDNAAAGHDLASVQVDLVRPRGRLGSSHPAAHSELQIGGQQMSIGFAAFLMRSGVVQILILAAPALIISMVVGLIISIIQATTSIQEQTLSFVPKIAAILLSLILFGPWMFTTLVQYTQGIFLRIPDMVK